MNQTTVGDRIPAIRTQLAAIFENLSGETHEPNDADTTFLEMGHDSLFLTQVAQKIQNEMRVTITFRQLLGDYSTIPTLAAFVDSQMPSSAPALNTAAPTVNTGAPRTNTVAPTVSALPAASVPAAGIEGLFRDQLQAMSQLINRQFEMLQGLNAPAMPTPAATPVSSVADAGPETPAEPPRSRRSRCDNREL